MHALLAMIVSWTLAGVISRVLLGAGLVLITSVSLVSFVNSMLNNFVSMISQAPAALLNILLLCGLGDSISIIGSAILFRVALLGAGRIIGIGLSS